MDNARFGLIALVLLGHLIEPMLDDHHLLKTIYRFIYVFHMPAFAFLSGAVSSANADRNLVRTVLFRLLLPYLVFQGLYTLAAEWQAWPDDGPGGIATPYWLLWYLLSLACWRLLLPLFAHLRKRWWIALMIALLAGLSTDIGYYFSLSRTLVFFPMFLLGWQRARHWRRLSGHPHVRRLALLTLALLSVAAYLSRLDPRWLYGSYSYGALAIAPLPGMLLRLLLIACAMAGTCAFLALIPRRRLAISSLGARSLGAYLLQGFLVNIAVGIGIFGVLAGWPRAILLPLLLTSAALLVAALSSHPVQRILAPVTTPRWLERRILISKP